MDSKKKSKKKSFTTAQVAQKIQRSIEKLEELFTTAQVAQK